eukprot:augustus_masked-scaffold_12-processed-gene-1.1-mRNA-1 protein AED:1.00 eAED:1.00 QI:0/0/0/0/1/1/2/0/369
MFSTEGDKATRLQRHDIVEPIESKVVEELDSGERVKDRHKRAMCQFKKKRGSTKKSKGKRSSFFLSFQQTKHKISSAVFSFFERGTSSEPATTSPNAESTEEDEEEKWDKFIEENLGTSDKHIEQFSDDKIEEIVMQQELTSLMLEEKKRKKRKKVRYREYRRKRINSIALSNEEKIAEEGDDKLAEQLLEETFDGRELDQQSSRFLSGVNPKKENKVNAKGKNKNRKKEKKSSIFSSFRKTRARLTSMMSIVRDNEDGTESEGTLSNNRNSKSKLSHGVYYLKEQDADSDGDFDQFSDKFVEAMVPENKVRIVRRPKTRRSKIEGNHKKIKIRTSRGIEPFVDFTNVASASENDDTKDKFNVEFSTAC